jgi:hypothetical protein
MFNQFVEDAVRIQFPREQVVKFFAPFGQQADFQIAAFGLFECDVLGQGYAFQKGTSSQGPATGFGGSARFSFSSSSGSTIRFRQIGHCPRKMLSGVQGWSHSGQRFMLFLFVQRTTEVGTGSKPGGQSPIVRHADFNDGDVIGHFVVFDKRCINRFALAVPPPAACLTGLH